MKFVALISGGKDSTFNILECLSEGHELIALANLYPPKNDIDEIDSHMYQSVGHEAIENMAKCINVPIFRLCITGVPIDKKLIYNPCLNDETENLYELLSTVKKHFPNIEGVSSGAILSNYQRNRVENVCKRLNLISLAYLWQRNQMDLLDCMVRSNINPIILKICSDGLTEEKHLGKYLSEVSSNLKLLSSKNGLNPCGEGGEYETLTIDAPFFTHCIKIKSTKVITLDDNEICDVKYIKITDMDLEKKDKGTFIDLKCYDPLVIKEKYLINVFKDTKNEIKENISVSFNKYIQRIPFISNIFKIINISVKIDNLEESARSLFEDAKVLLNSSNISFNDVVYVNLFIDDMKNFHIYNKIYEEYFNESKPPRACVATNKRHLSMDLTIRNVTNMNLCTKQLNLMHIESYSHWAPAVIGPYSQASVYSTTKIDDDDDDDALYTCFISGQIGMNAEDLQLISLDNLESQFILILRHISRLIIAQSPNIFNWSCLQCMNCICTNENDLNICMNIFHDIICNNEQSLCLCERIKWLCVTGALPKYALVEVQSVFQYHNWNLLNDCNLISSSSIYNENNYWGFD